MYPLNPRVDCVNFSQDSRLFFVCLTIYLLSLYWLIKDPNLIDTFRICFQIIKFKMSNLFAVTRIFDSIVKP